MTRHAAFAVFFRGVLPLWTTGNFKRIPFLQNFLLNIFLLENVWSFIKICVVRVPNTEFVLAV